MKRKNDVKVISREIDRKIADHEHHVVSVINGRGCMKSPCPTCPWRRDMTGLFPAEAFVISAHTSYDMSNEKFGCHVAGTESPMTCAGFILRGAQHNLAVRLGHIRGEYDHVIDAGADLFDSYWEMAVENGVPSDHECLEKSRRD